MTFKHISLIYNPKSSGGSVRLAQELYAELRQRWPELGVEVLPTKYHGHATDLAEIAGRANPRSLIVAVGGDGTYHEVINGIMRLPAGRRPACLVAPAGNANDHAREMGIEADLIERIERSQLVPFDVLKLATLNPNGGDALRYAHS
jgi:diacylglycerol kinase (ATP)